VWKGSARYLDTCIKQSVGQPGGGQALERRERAPRAHPSGTVAPAPLAARERLRGRMTGCAGCPTPVSGRKAGYGSV